jgi:hypothetical protein
MKRDERGVSLIIVAMSMVMLLGVSAFVIDLGPVYNEKRQDQTAADAGALAGAQQLLQGDTAVVTAAKAVSRLNLQQTYTDTAWNTAWTNCTDPDRDATKYPNVSPLTACVSYGKGFTRLRVRLPDQVITTNFSKVFGVASITTHAAAEAQLSPPAGSGTLPLITDNYFATPQNQFCLVGNGCNGATSDNLRAMDSPLTGNPQFGGTVMCRPASPYPAQYNTRVEYEVALGLDHSVTTYGSSTVTDNCSATSVPNTIYSVDIQSLGGVSALLPGLRRGLITGTTDTGGNYPDGLPARMLRYPSNTGSFTPAWGTQVINCTSPCSPSRNITVDSRPLWQFMPSADLPVGSPNPPTNTNIPAECKRSTITNKSGMQSCIAAWWCGTGQSQCDGRTTPVYSTPIFTARNSANPPGIYDIQLSPRLAFVPTVNTSPGPSCSGTDTGPPSSSICPVDSFKMVFIQTLYLQNSQTSEFNPGESCTSACTLNSFTGISALRIFDAMLPAGIIGTGPGGGAIPNIPVSLIR